MRYLVIKSYYKEPSYGIRILIALDELGAVILKLPNDITISSWCGKNKNKNIVAKFGYFVLDKMQYHHCEYAIIDDKGRAQEILKYLENNE